MCIHEGVVRRNDSLVYEVDGETKAKGVAEVHDGLSEGVRDRVVDGCLGKSPWYVGDTAEGPHFDKQGTDRGQFRCVLCKKVLLLRKQLDGSHVLDDLHRLLKRTAQSHVCCTDVPLQLRLSVRLH